MSDILSDDVARFSVRSVWMIVAGAFVLGMAVAVMQLSVASARADATAQSNAITARLNIMQADYDRKGIGDLPRQIGELRFVLCATNDAARKAACDQISGGNPR